MAPKDRVFGLAVFGLATYAMARAGDVRIIPDGLSFEEAATLPVVFMTSWHALETVAHLKAGERILIHAGAGGVGMAAIQIAHHLGAEVIASAGSPAKRALLNVLGVKHVIDSRRADFAEAVMELTGGKGVDVVLNSLAAEGSPWAFVPRTVWPVHRDRKAGHSAELSHSVADAEEHVVPWSRWTRSLVAMKNRHASSWKNYRLGRAERAASAAVPLVPGMPH